MKCQGWHIIRQIISLSSLQTSKFPFVFFSKARNWSLFPTFSQQQRPKTLTLKILTVFCVTLLIYLQLWLKCRKQKDRKLGSFENPSDKSVESYTQRAVLIMFVCSMSWKPNQPNNLSMSKVRHTFALEQFQRKVHFGHRWIQETESIYGTQKVNLKLCCSISWQTIKRIYGFKKFLFN